MTSPHFSPTPASSPFKTATLLLASLPWLGLNVLPPAQAQPIQPDGSTDTRVTPDGQRFDIGGGSLSGDGQNLFHSFQEFGLDAGQAANFLSDPQIQNILSRVTGGNLSLIDGLIQVSGSQANLFLMNPAGVVFGANARLDLSGSFTATTATGIEFGEGWFNAIGPNSYLNLLGNPTGFEFGTPETGVIVNGGDLEVLKGESLSLVGGTVVNTGSLSAPGGSVTIAAVPGTSRVQMSQAGNLLKLEFALPVNDQGQVLPFRPLDLHQLLTTGKLDNTGLSATPSGGIALTDGGTEIPTTVGTTIVSGSLDAANTSLGAVGGQVDVFGTIVGLVDATVDASGDAGGGSIRIGGDFQGRGTVPNADFTLVSPGTSILADALRFGDGGRAIVWADGTTRFGGSLSAQGGTLGGNGGFAEISGKHLSFNGQVSLQASNGAVGTVLFDPTNIVVSNAGGADGASGGDVLFAETGGEPWSVTPGQLDAVAGNITLQADSNITFTDAVGLTTSGASLTAQAGNNIAVNADITTNNGAVNLTANDPGGTVTGTGAITMGVGTTIDTGTQGITLNAAGDITLSNLNTSGSISVTSSNGGIINTGTVIDTGTQGITLNAAGDITLSNLNTSGGILVTSSNGGIINTGTVSGLSGITLRADTMDLGVGSSLTGGTNTVNLRIDNIGIGIDLGSAAGATGGQLNLSQAELSTITAGNLILTASNGIAVTSAIVLNPAQIPILTLGNGLAGSITQTSPLSVQNLSLGAVGGGGALDVTLTNASNDFDTVSGSGGNVSIVDVDAISLGTLASTGNLDVTSGDLVVDNVSSTGGTVTLTSAATIEESGADAAADITAGTIALNAANGIGTAGQIETTGTTLSANTTNGNINLGNIATAATSVTSVSTGTGSINLTQTGGQTLDITTATTTDGAITLANDNANLNVVTATAGGTNNLTLTTTTGGNIFVDNVTADGDTVTITSATTIQESGTDAGAEITAATANLTATGVGTGANSIETNVATLNVDTSGAGGDQFLSETDDLTAINLNAGTGNVSLSSGVAIQDGDASADVIATSAKLDSATGVGTSANPINTTLTNLAARASTSGDVVISNTGSLTITTVDSLSGVTATTGGVNLTASSPLTVSTNVTSATDITLTASDSAGTGDDLTIDSGATVQSTGGNVTLNAGDNFSLTAGSTVASTTGTVAINVDPTVTDADGGTLTIAGAVTSGAGTTLQGGDDADTFNIQSSIVANASGGDGNDAFNFTNAGSLGTGTIDGQGGIDTVIGDDDGNAFTVSGSDSGTLTGKTNGWSNVENLTGGTGTDTFTFTNAGNLTGAIDGSTGTNTLTGDDDGNTFAITGADSGTLTGKTSGWINIQNLTGGTGDDSFTFANAGNLTGAIDGSTGTNTLTGDDDGNTFAITGADSGTLTGKTSGWINIQNLTGGTGDDSFTFTNAGSLTGAIDGAAGIDTVIGDDDGNAFTVTGADSGTLTGKTSGWSNVENLTGGTGTDTFTFTNAGNLTGAIDGAAGTDTVTGDDDDNAFTVTGTNSGTLTGKTSGWSNVENLTGGTDTDTFTFTNAGSLTGAVDGAAGTDTVTGDDNGNAFTVTGTNSGTLTGKTSGWSNVENLVGGTGVDTFTVSGGIVTSVDGAGGTSDTLVGDNTANTWTLTGGNVGNLSNLNGTIAFSNVENLTGGNQQDSFLFTNGDSLTGTITGGDPTTSPGDILSVTGNGTTDTATYTPATTTGNGVVNFSGSDINFTGLESIDISSMLAATVSPAGANDSLTLTNGTDFISGGSQAIQVSGSTGGTPISTVALFNNTTVTIDTTATAGTDTINIASASNAHNNTNLTINTGTETGDAININGDTTVTGQASFTTGGAITNGGGTLTANTAKLDSGTGVGTGATPIATNVNTLAAQASTSGGVFVSNAAALTIDTVDALSDVTTSGGAIVVKTTNGSVTVNDGADADSVGISAGGANNVLVQAQGAGSNVTINTGVTSGGGNVSVLAANNINLPNAVSDITTTGADIDLQATAGTITSVSGVAVTSNGAGDIRQQVAGDLTLTHLTNAGTGNANLIAGGSILDDADADAVDVQASGLLLTAGTNVGENTNFIETTVNTVSATAGGAQGINLLNSGAITVDTVAVAINQVQMDASPSTTTNTGSDLTTTANNGPIVLKSSNGSITIEGGGDTTGVSANGAGNILLQAQGTTSDVDLNARVISGTGNISINAEQDVLQDVSTTDPEIQTGDIGTVDVLAGRNITMVDGVQVSTVNGNIRYGAGTNITLGQLTTGGSGTADVSVVATAGNITDAGDANGSNITADQLRLEAGGNIGSTSDKLDITVNTLSGVASGTDGIFLLATGAVDINQVDDFSINRVGMDGLAPLTPTDTTRADLETLANGGSVVLVTNGNLTVHDGDADAVGVSANGDGNILIQAQGTGSDVILNAGVMSGSGYISVLGANNVRQDDPNADITTGAGSIDVQAFGGSIDVVDGAMATNDGGNILYQATGNIDLSDFNAGSGDITVITSNGDILNTSTNPISTSQLSLSAINGTIGQATNPLLLSVDRVAATAMNGIFLTADKDIVVGQVGTGGNNEVFRVQMDATLQEIPISSGTGVSRSDLVTTNNGSIVLTTTDGSITVEDGSAALGNADGIGVNANGAGNILLQAGPNGSINLDTAVQSGSGSISILATNNVNQRTATADITTGGNIDVEATAGSITMATNSLASTTNGNILYRAAQTNQNVTIEQLSAPNGNIGVIAGQSIIDLDGDTTNQDIIASGLLLEATTGGIGTLPTTNAATDFGIPFAISASTLTAKSGATGINLVEADSVTLDTVTVNIQRVGSDATLSLLPTLPSQSDVVTTGGNVLLRTPTGSISLSSSNSINGDITTTSATGNGGDVTLQARDQIQVGTIDTSSSANSGGAVSLTSSTGTVTTNAISTNSTGISGNGADIALNALGNIQVVGAINTSASAGSGGSVGLNSTQGSINTGDITSSGGGGNGGTTNLQAASTITTGNIATNSANSGGNVTVTTTGTGAAITTGAIDTSSATNGGDVRVTTDGGAITIGNIDTFSTAGGAGGDVYVAPVSESNFPTIIGVTDTDNDNAGDGGDVNVFTTDIAVTIGNINTSSTSNGNNSTSTTPGDLTGVNNDFTNLSIGDIITRSEAGSGQAGDVTIRNSTRLRDDETGRVGGSTSDNDIQVGAIDARGQAPGSGGVITAIAERFFRAINTFFFSDTQASIVATSASTESTGSITINHGGNGDVRFEVASLDTNNGTAGGLFSGDGDFQRFISSSDPGQNQFLFTTFTPSRNATGNISLFSVPNPTGQENLEVGINVATQVEDLGFEPANLQEVQEALRAIQADTGVVPAIIYVQFVAGDVQGDETGEIQRQISPQDQLLRLVLITPNIEDADSGVIIRQPEEAVSLQQVRNIGAELINEVSLSEYIAIANPNPEEIKGKLESEDYRASAEQLYEWLIQPLDQDLQKLQTQAEELARQANLAESSVNLLFSLPGVLNLLPIAALHDGNNFLIQQGYSVGLAPQLGLLDFTFTPLGKDESRILVMGTGEFPPIDEAENQNPLNRLPGAQVEVEEISNLWGAEPLLDDDFTIEALRSNHEREAFNIIHLATHADFSGAEEDNFIRFKDEKLLATEFDRLGLNNPSAELLVLSACKTGVSGAELGFAGSALRAGVKTVLASLWQVSDMSTLGLMAEFYSQLREDVPIRAEALRRAQLALISGQVEQRETPHELILRDASAVPLPGDIMPEDKEFIHPYFWAGFTMVGSPW